MRCLWVLGAYLVALTAGVRAIIVKDLKAPVILTTLPFNLEVEIVYDTTTLSAFTAVQFVVQDSASVLANITQNAWQDGQLLTSFVLDGLVLQRAGLQTLNVSAFSSTDPLQTTTWKILPVSVVPKGVSVIPFIVTLALASYSGSTIISLLSGIWIAALIEFQNLVEATLRTVDAYILEAIIDPGHTTILMFTFFLGGILAMMNRAGGSQGMAKFFEKYVTSPIKAQVVTVMAGLLIFFDDYACLLLVGSTMRPITDSQFVSREKLCFIVDSIAAPMAALVPISSWTAFEAILIQAEAAKLIAQGNDLRSLGFETSGFLGFLRLVPYMFYPIFLLTVQIAIICTALEFGPMLSAERRARYRHVLIDYEHVTEEDRVILADDEPLTQPTPNTPKLFANALIPILMLISLTIGSMVGIGIRNFPEDDPEASSNIFAYTDGVLALLYSTFLTGVFQVLMYRVQFRPQYDPRLHATGEDPRWLFPHRVLYNKILSVFGKDNEAVYASAEPITGFKEGVECWLAGVKTMAPSVVVLVLAWSIGDAMERIGIGRYLASEVAGTITPESLPALMFILCSGVSLATGSSFGTMALMFPIVSPLAFIAGNKDPELYYASLAGILAGSVYGSHVSPISDTTILSSLSTRCDLQRHVITQFPYATLAAFWAVVAGCIPSGQKTLPPVGSNLLGIFLVIISVLILGAPVSSPRGRLDLITYLYAMFRWKVLGHNPATIESLRLQIMVIDQEGEKDDVIGQGIRRDYLIWALRKTFDSTRFEPHELLHDRKSRKSATPSLKEAEEHDAAKHNKLSPNIEPHDS